MVAPVPPRLAQGDRVHVQRSDGAHAYVVEGPRQYSGGWQYRVNPGGSTGGPTWYAEHLLTPCPENQLRWRSPDGFRRDLLLAKLRHRLSDTLFTYKSSRTLFEPYQFRPVLRFLASQQHRLLIADEVGLGKTIEAAMIYLELKARLGSELKRVLIVCPSRLRAKWHDELRSRFDEEFQDVNSAQAVRSLLSRWRDYRDAYRFRGIVSYELLRSESLAREWAQIGVHLDLIIADEAHVMRNTTSLTHALGGILTDNADAAVFLTATPLMLGNPDLFNLLHLLAPDEYADFASFPAQVEPNGYVNLAARAIGAAEPVEALDTLRSVEKTAMRERFLRDPRYQDTLARLRLFAETATEPSRDDRVRLQRQILDLSTLSAIFTRTRKREVANAKPRQAFTISVVLSSVERAFYDGFLAQVRRDVRKANAGAASFAVIMRERMAASCLPAVREALRQSYEQRRTASLEVERSGFHLSPEYEDDRQAQLEWIRSSGEQPELSSGVPVCDTKFGLFERTLRERLAQRAESKALVFSYFRGTLRYLLDQLGKLGHEVAVIHGGVPIDERQKIIEKFRTDPRFRVLLSSEVGAEGLDFQFCDVLVNYDLPWNPMQVEQRIGRLDRFGQEAPLISIYNFVIEDSIETRIFERLYQRIGIFERAVGDLEAILGQEIRKLSLEVFRAQLTPEQEIEEAEKAAQRIVALQQAREELERQQDELVGQGAILDAAVEDAVEGGHVVYPQEVESLVRTFLHAAVDPAPSFDRDDDEACWLLRINHSLRDVLLPYTNNDKDARSARGIRDRGGSTERFKKAVADAAAIPVTFDADLARRRPLLEFITSRHVLAVAARDYWEDQSRCIVPATRVELPGPWSEVGEGHVFVHALVEEGLARQARLQAVVVLDDGRLAPQAAEGILRWIATSDQPSTPIPMEVAALDDAKRLADAHVAQQRDQVQHEREERNASVIAARKVAIETSFAVKERSIRQAVQATSDPNAQRMNQGRLHTLRARRAEKLAELEQAVRVTVSSQLVAIGRVRIVPAMGEPVDPIVEPAAGLVEAIACPVDVLSRSDPAADGRLPADGEPWPEETETVEAEQLPVILSGGDQPPSIDDELASPSGEPVKLPPAAVSVPASTGEVAMCQKALSTDQDVSELPIAAPPLDAASAPVPGDDMSDVIEASEMASPKILDPALVQHPVRAIVFPKDCSVGKLFIRDPDTDASWRPVGPAQERVEVSANLEVCLRVDPHRAGDWSWLADLGPYDLVYLVLDGVDSARDVLKHLAQLSGLRELSLRDALVVDGDLRALSQLSQLEAICLAGTHVGNLGVLALKPLSGLRALDLNHTTIDSGGAVHLSNLAALEVLELANTGLTDGGLVSVGKLPRLAHLDLRGTRTTPGGRHRWLPPHVTVLADE